MNTAVARIDNQKGYINKARRILPAQVTYDVTKIVLKVVAHIKKLRHTCTKFSHNYDESSYVFEGSPTPGWPFFLPRFLPQESRESMSPLRRHSGGRPRSAHSILDVAERWGISHKAARRLATRRLSDDAMAILVCDSRRNAAAQRREIAAQGRYTGGMRALGMRSRVPAGRA
jgi:hypothetical protein